MTDRAEPPKTPAWQRLLTFEALVSGLNSLGSLWIVVLMVVINIDIMGRTLLSMPLRGVPELVKLSIVAIVFIQLGHTLRSGRMTRSDGLLRILRTRLPRLSHAMTLVFNLVGAGLFVLVFKANPRSPTRFSTASSTTPTASTSRASPSASATSRRRSKAATRGPRPDGRGPGAPPAPSLAARPWQVGQCRLRHELWSGCSRPQPSQRYMWPPSTAVRHASMAAMTLSRPASMRPSRRSRNVAPARRKISATPARTGSTAV